MELIDDIYWILFKYIYHIQYINQINRLFYLIHNTREDFERILDIPTATLSTKSMLIYLHICQFFQFNLNKN